MQSDTEQIDTGTCYVVATPIGNLADLSSRAVEILNSVDLVLAEDTRTFGRLAARYGITTPSKSYHEHNEQRRAAEALETLASGSSVALVSEAGTPTISDPGYRLVRSCRENHVPVVALPGPCAAIAALSISGFETDKFVFEGFLPQKAGKRARVLEEALDRGITSIFYESPHRIIKTLKALAELRAEAEVFIARELTKLYEEALYGSAAQVLEQLESRNSIKGEFVLILRGEKKRLKQKID